MLKDRSVLVLYVDAVCNLKCRYCYIDKNPALIQIDKLLEESFKGDYYFEFAKKVFPDKFQLKRIEVWGGEPTLYLERAHHTIKLLTEYYPHLDEVFFSTNLSLDDSIDKIFNLIDVLGKVKDRPIKLSLQLSLDGPTYINDFNRGEGVTQKFTKNFVKMMAGITNKLEENQNVEVNAFFKPTLDDSCIKILQNKQKIIEYFQFFEIYYDITRKVFHPRFRFDTAVPNTAEPEPHTKEDGLRFANFCKITREIDKENATKHYFKYYNRVTIFPPNGNENRNPYCKENAGACGSGKSVIGLLPNDMISTCHNGFTEVISDYKKYCNEHKDQVNSSLDFTFFKYNIKNPMVFPYEGLKLYETIVDELYGCGHCSQITNMVSEIQLLARNNQINPKYNEKDEALIAANFIMSHASFCIRDNINTNGCISMIQPGFLRLFLNGAAEYIIEADKERR